MTTQQTENQTMGTYGIYGTNTTEACPLFNEENKKLLLQVASTFEQDVNAKGIKVLSMYHSGLEHTFEWIVEAPGDGVAGLNIAPEVPAMTMFRHIIFGAIIGILSKSLFEVRK